MGTQVPEFELRQEAADEIERLTDQCIAEGRIVRKCNEEIERLRHEIDVQCSSEYVERILKENERLRDALKEIDECLWRLGR
jgi:hypothetical protein